jgi:hypothetical protein
MNLGIPADASKAVLDAAGFQNQQKLECLTADELKGDFAKLMADELASDDDCKMSNVKTTELLLRYEGEGQRGSRDHDEGQRQTCGRV